MTKLKTVQIKSCTDSSLWYSDHIDSEFELHPHKDANYDDLAYWVRDNSGYINIIYKKDGKLL